MDFISEINKLFNIAAQDAKTTIMKDSLRSKDAKIAYLEFLEDQGGARKLYLGGFDKTYERRVKAKEKRYDEEEKRKINEFEKIRTDTMNA